MKTIEVVAAIIVKDGKILSTQRGYGDLEGKWEFPGGKIEPGETKEDAIKREISEEMNAKIIPQKLFATIEYDYEKFHLTMHTFICKLDGDFELLEHHAAKWLDMNDLKNVDWCPADVKVAQRIIEEQII